MSREMDIGEEVENAPLSSRHWRMVVVLGLITLFDSYDLFVAGSTIPFAIRSWHLKPSEAGLMVSVGLFGFLIGALAGGPLADKVGRKPTLIVALFASSLFSMATAALARDYASYLILRLITGLAMGMLLPVAVTLINEIAPRRTDSVLVGCITIGWSSGGILAALAGTLGQQYGWASMYWVGGAGVPMALLAWPLLMESPRFLTIRDRQSEARAVMTALVPGTVYGQDVRFVTDEDPHRRGSIRRLLEPRFRRGTVIVWICACLSLFMIFGLSSWLPQVLTLRGESFGSSFGFVALLQFMAVLGGVGGGWLADRVGSQKMLITSWIVGGAAIMGLALFNIHWANFILISLTGFFILGAQPVLNNFTATLYSTEIRTTGVGAQLGIGRLGGILGPYFVGWLQQLSGGTAPMFMAMAVAAVLCAATLAMLGKQPARLEHGRFTKAAVQP